MIIYASNYGSSHIYAHRLKALSHFDLVSYDEIKTIDPYEAIIYIGSLYAGGVKGLAKTLKCHDLKDKKLYLLTVGISDPKLSENHDNIIQNIKTQVAQEIFAKMRIYHLRGALNYSKLSFKHRIMMYLVYRKALRTAKEERSKEDEAIIETYGKTVSFVDFDELNKIWEKIDEDLNGCNVAS